MANKAGRLTVSSVTRMRLFSQSLLAPNLGFIQVMGKEGTTRRRHIACSDLPIRRQGCMLIGRNEVCNRPSLLLLLLLAPLSFNTRSHNPQPTSSPSRPCRFAPAQKIETHWSQLRPNLFISPGPAEHARPASRLTAASRGG